MKATEFAVDINIIKGAVDFEVFPSNAQEKTGDSWKSDNDYHLVINSISTYTAKNEFLVKVRSNDSAIFDIVFNRIGACSVYKIGRMVTVDVDAGKQRCQSYIPTDLNDL
jgi:hypothetical protein